MRLFLVCLIPILVWSQSTQAIYKECTDYTAIAKSAFSELQSRYPESDYALVLRGEARFQNRQYEAALTFYLKAAGLRTGLRGIHAALASVYAAMGNRAKAEDESKAEGSPDCSSEKLVCDFAAARYGDVLREAGLIGGAERLYWRARAARELADESCNQLASLPDSAELHERNARELEARSKYRDAAGEWRTALKLSRGNSLLVASLSRALFLSQDYQAVLPELKDLLKLQPESPNGNFFVGDALFESEQVEEAVPFLLTALKRNPRLLPAHVALGLCYSKLGEAAKAIPHLRAGLPLDQEGSIYYQLSRAYQSTGQAKLAQEMMDRYRQRFKAPKTNAPVQ